MDFLELADGDLGVDCRRFQLDVPEHGLEEPDISPIFQHQGGHRVAEQVASPPLADVGGADVLPCELGPRSGPHIWMPVHVA